MSLHPNCFLKLLFFLLCFQEVCLAQDSVHIELSAPKIQNGEKMQFSECIVFRGQIVKKHDLEIINGKADLKVATAKGDRFLLHYKQQELTMYLEPGLMKINIPDTVLTAASIAGSKSNQDIDRWLANWRKEPIYRVLINAQQKWLNETNTEKRIAAQIEYDSVKNIFDQQGARFIIETIKANPNSYINSSLLSNARTELSQQQFADLYRKLSNDNKNNAYGRFIKYTLDSLYVNGTAPDFAQPDTSGKSIRLADFKGQYVLLDFWASWCVPCRAENPNLVKVYQRFKNRNFSIIGVSFDSKRDLWTDAIKKDNLSWTQVSDLRGWRNALSGKYDISSIPSNVLISPTGKVVARNLRGETLTNKLEEIFP